jgi:hypothetical protein
MAPTDVTTITAGTASQGFLPESAPPLAPETRHQIQRQKKTPELGTRRVGLTRQRGSLHPSDLVRGTHVATRAPRPAPSASPLSTKQRRRTHIRARRSPQSPRRHTAASVSESPLGKAPDRTAREGEACHATVSVLVNPVRRSSI